ncbi:MAG: SGNH/GDSL hydrolase family protein [Clostridia bacterium]|nr:SGNH/GDSL hydrolase family protein [Clostridia bacterium]
MKRFPDNARVCFVGDSITAAFNYVARVADYYLEKFPDAHVRFFNSGVAGGTARSQRIFLADDTLCHKPTHAVIMVGVNDSARWVMGNSRSAENYAFLVSCYEAYKKNLADLCDELEKNGVEITLCTPVPYAEYQPVGQEPFHGGYALIAGYADFCRTLAAQRGYPLCDYHSYVTQKLQTENLYNDDRIHPNDKGHHYMAECFLKLQGLEMGEFCDIPKKYDELRRVSMVVRDIFAVELMVIGDLNYGWSIEQKTECVKKYIDEGKAPTDYFKRITEDYLKYKPLQDKYADLTEQLTEELMGQG